MKPLKLIMSILVFGLVTMSIYSCGGNKNADNTKTEQVKEGKEQGKEYTSAYICPMHCKDSGSDKPGKCPVCKMDYKVNDKHKQETHDHDSHEGHDHGSHEGHNHEGHSH